MTTFLIDQASYPQLARFYNAQVAGFPEHAATLARRFKETDASDFEFLERLAAQLALIVGDDLPRYCDDYRFIASIVLEEEIFFRRENRYRLSTFAEADAKVYSNKIYMTRYMNGLLMSQLWWRNHTSVMRYFSDTFLEGNKPGYRHLEIGPGHGLFLHTAAMHRKCGSASGWDVSEASLALVDSTLAALRCERPVDLTLVNMFDAPATAFDSITFSEVLEHLESPKLALAAISALLAPGGRAFINAPVNSPAPDHLTLFRAPEDIVGLVEAAGLVVEDTLFAPTAGATLERARKMALAISTVVIARKLG